MSFYLRLLQQGCFNPTRVRFKISRLEIYSSNDRSVDWNPKTTIYFNKNHSSFKMFRLEENQNLLSRKSISDNLALIEAGYHNLRKESVFLSMKVSEKPTFLSILSQFSWDQDNLKSVNPLPKKMWPNLRQIWANQQPDTAWLQQLNCKARQMFLHKNQECWILQSIKVRGEKLVLHSISPILCRDRDTKTFKAKEAKFWEICREANSEEA